MDAAAVRALAESVLDGANHLDAIHWPALSSEGMSGSSVLPAAACPSAEDRLADVVAHMRTWAAAARAAAGAVQLAEEQQAGRLGAPR
ncbi:MAG: hypothetical protein QOI01_6850 [Mycobacterium sp.]|jgi:hypothetical protein|nr:hypothetical protein [Mycobacterium sp.]